MHDAQLLRTIKRVCDLGDKVRDGLERQSRGLTKNLL